jgi:hypothetical protein
MMGVCNLTHNITWGLFKVLPIVNLFLFFIKKGRSD